MRPVCVIFDFDGVIVNSLNFHLLAWGEAVQLCFGKQLEDGIKQKIFGLSTDSISRLLINHYKYPGISGKHLAEIKRQWLVENIHSIPLINGAKEMLSYLDNRKIPYGIASNAPRKYIENVLYHHQIKSRVVMGIEDSSSPKPSPEPYLVCAQRLGMEIDDHKNTIVLEDSCHGILAGVRAGMYVIGITTDQPREALIKSGAKLTCKDLHEVRFLDLFKS